MPKRTRSSRTTAASTATLPPCELMTMSLRQPVRATLSPISVQARTIVSIEKVSVPGYCEVLVRLADRLDGQEQHRQVVGNPDDGALEIALVDERVDADRQMRPMLLDRGDGQHRDDFRHVGR